MIRNGLSGKNDVLKSLCETYVVTIRNMQLPKKPRVFDVTVNSKGEILRYDIQNIKGNLFIEDVEVHQQIMAALAEKYILLDLPINRIRYTEIPTAGVKTSVRDYG